MHANRELDQLLERLRLGPTSRVALDGVESRVWQQIEARAAQMQRPRLRLSFLLASVAAAFVWGVFSTAYMPESAPGTRTFLVEEVDLLPQDLGGPRL